VTRPAGASSPPRDAPAVGEVLGTFLRGTEHWIHDQLRFLRAHRAAVLAKHRAGRESFPWSPVYALSERTLPEVALNRALGRVAGYSPFFLRAARTEGVRLLHAHFGHLGLFALPLARKLGVPLLTSFYGVDMWKHPQGVQGLRRKYAGLFARGDGFLVEGPAARERLVEIGCPAEKVHVHRLGIDPAEVPFVERRVGEDGEQRVLMAARFTEKKGLSYGVDAFCRAAARHSGLRLTVVGDAQHRGEARIGRELHALVARHGMGDRVRFTGFLPLERLDALAREHHLLLHPSVHARDGDAEGGHPVVLTRMAASGMPVLATRHCDIPEVVAHGETGWLCAERSAEELAAVLEEVAAAPELLPAFGRRARALVEERYDARRETLDATYAKFIA
jgi:colanic acid/amylovoran biosynthesis glycosyltransferase